MDVLIWVVRLFGVAVLVCLGFGGLKIYVDTCSQDIQNEFV